MKESALVIERLSVHGATLLLIQDHSLPVVRFVATVRPGALADPQGSAGLTRVMLDLTLRGTQSRDRHTFNAALEEMGSSLSAATGMELGMWRGMTLKRNLTPTFALLAEAMARPAFDEAELTPLVEEAVEGLRADRDDDETVAEVFLRRALFRGHPLGRSPQGEVADLQGITAPLVRAAHAARIVPGALVVAMTGDLTTAEATRALTALVDGLASVPAPEVALPAFVESERLSILIVDKPERTQAQLRIACRGPAGSDPDALAFWLGVMAFGGTFTSPLTHEVRDVRGWSYGAHAAFDRLSSLKAPLVLRSAPATENAVDCLALELDLFKGFARGAVAGDTLEFARSYVLNRYPLEIATSSDLAMAALRHELLGEPPERAFRIPELVLGLDLDAIGPTLARHLRPDGVSVVIVATAATVEDTVRARFPDADLSVVDFREGLGFKLTP